MKPHSIAIIMTTCPREQPTIDYALDSLPDYAVIIHGDPEMKGAFQAFDRALKSCIAAGREYCLVIPDDMVFEKGWFEKVEPFLNEPNLGYIALYCPKGLGERYKFKEGVNEVKGGWASSWGGCYLMPTEVAEAVTNHQFYQDHLNGKLSGEGLFNYAKGKRIDHCIPEVIHRLGLKQLYHAPSLCKHIGYTSTLGHKHTEHEEPFQP